MARCGANGQHHSTREEEPIMKGHIRERSPGRWAIVIEQRNPETGRRKRKWHSFSGTKREAQVECARLVSAVRGGTYIEPSKTTVMEFLEQWLRDVRTRVSQKTHERYAQICLKNIGPLLGAVVLAKLKPEHISEAYAKALAAGRRNGSGGLSPRTVRQACDLEKRFRSGGQMGNSPSQPGGSGERPQGKPRSDADL
jgi:hypothetical protein